jgi:hypothetical protein
MAMTSPDGLAVEALSHRQAAELQFLVISKLIGLYKLAGKKAIGDR